MWYLGGKIWEILGKNEMSYKEKHLLDSIGLIPRDEQSAETITWPSLFPISVPNIYNLDYSAAKQINVCSSLQPFGMVMEIEFG